MADEPGDRGRVPRRAPGRDRHAVAGPPRGRGRRARRGPVAARDPRAACGRPPPGTAPRGPRRPDVPAWPGMGRGAPGRRPRERPHGRPRRGGRVDGAVSARPAPRRLGAAARPPRRRPHRPPVVARAHLHRARPAPPPRGDRQPDPGDQRPPVRRAALAERVLRRAAARPADAPRLRPQPRAGRHAARDQRPAPGDDDGRPAVRVPDGARARLGRGGRDGAGRRPDRAAADGRRDPVRPGARRPVHHARVLPSAAPARRALPRRVRRADGRGPGVRDPGRAGAGRGGRWSVAYGGRCAAR